jgi:peptidyl-prolyl cis-trans isomerase A (cyclophilin A)
MRTRLLKTGLLLLALTACTKDKEKQAEGKPPTGSPPPTTQTAPPTTPGTQPGPEATAGSAGPAGTPAPRTRPPAENPGPWQQKALQGQDLYATLQTSEGDIVVKLFSKDAPLTVANFVGLATGEQTWTDPKTNQVVKNKPLYQGVLFHRVIPDFMIQGGDPLGVGSGSPGYTFEDEFQSGRAFDKPGLLAMANRGPETNGSQFFITTSTPTHLTNRHTIFGEVVKGYEVAERISKVPTAERNRPVKDVVLKKVTISDTQPK